jgi:hypothetical protein
VRKAERCTHDTVAHVARMRQRGFPGHSTYLASSMEFWFAFKHGRNTCGIWWGSALHEKVSFGPYIHDEATARSPYAGDSTRISCGRVYCDGSWIRTKVRVETKSKAVQNNTRKHFMHDNANAKAN